MEGLDLDNILDEDAIGLFNEVETQDNTPDEQAEEAEENEETKEETAEVDPESLFGEPESVGSESEDIEEKEDTPQNKGDGSSPKNFFSSIAEAFAEEGILPNLDNDTIKSIKTPEDFRKAIDEYIQSELSEQQKRVKEALDNNVEISAVKQYEGIISYLDSIKPEDIKAETEQAEELRKRLLYQDYINRGFSNERAAKEVDRSVKNGTDIEDASDALESCKSFYQKSYNGLLDEARKAKEDEETTRKSKAEQLRKNILDTKNKFFGDLDVDQNTRQKIFDNIAKPVYKDPNTGYYLTAIQKYESENSEEFLTKLGLLFTLTDGFQSLDKLVNKKAKKVIKKGFKDLENTLNNTSRDSFGNLKFTTGVNDSESYLGKGVKLAL